MQRRELPGFALAETAYPARLKMPRHGHELAYFTLVLQGGYNESVGRTTRSCAPATLVFHPPDEEHAVEFHQHQVRIFRLETKPHWLERVREHSTLFDAPSAFDNGTPSQLALRLYHESQAKDAAAPLAIEGLTLELLAAASRAATKHETQPPRWLQRARDLLHAEITETPAMAEVAQTVGVHPVSLARAFRLHFGCTIGDYLRRLRIEQACQQLAHSDLSLLEIAHAAGFYDQSHFSRTFKRQIGMTPTGYRLALNKG